MTTLTPLVLSLVLASAAAFTAGNADPEPPPAQYVPSQVILKFRSGSSGAAAVDEAVETGGEKNARLAAYVGNLGDKLGMPLQAQQVTSGNEVVVGIDLRRFAQNTVERLLAMQAVAGAEDDSSERAGPQSAVTLRVSFAADSQFAAALAEAWGAGAKMHEQLDAFIESASRGLDLPLVYQLDNEGELIVLVDMLQVTETLASRLGELEEVEYAELNQIMQRMG